MSQLDLPGEAQDSLTGHWEDWFVSAVLNSSSLNLCLRCVFRVSPSKKGNNKFQNHKADVTII